MKVGEFLARFRGGLCEDYDVGPPEQSVERTPSSPEQTLDGAWFRRERERVAIGRKSLATKLGSTESRLDTLEWRRQQVPPEWLPMLRTLEFRIPESVGPEPSVAAVDQVDQAESSVLVVESVTTEATMRSQPSLLFGFLSRHRSCQRRSYRRHLSKLRARPSTQFASAPTGFASASNSSALCQFRG